MKKMINKSDSLEVAKEVLANLPFYRQLDEFSVTIDRTEEGYLRICTNSDTGRAETIHYKKEAEVPCVSTFLFEKRKHFNIYAD